MPTIEEIQAEVVKSNDAVTVQMAEIRKELDANKAALAEMKKAGDRPEATAEHGKKMTELEKSLDGAQSALAAAQAELVTQKSSLAEQAETMAELQKALQRGGLDGGGDDEAWKTAGLQIEELIKANEEVFRQFSGKTMNNANALPSLTMKSFGREPAFQGFSPMDVKKALTTAATTNFVMPYQIPGYLPLTRRSLRIRDLLPMVPTTARHILYIRQTGFTSVATSSVTSITQAAGVATVTQAAHGYDDGDRVLIAGSTIAAYNGAKSIDVTGANTYTFLIASGTASPATGTITAVRLNNYGAAGFVAEGTDKPESQMFFEERTADVQVIAHWMKASRQVLDDVPGLRQGIDSDLIYGLLRKEDVSLLYATGTGGQTAGILTDPAIQTYTWSAGVHGDTKTDAIRRSRTRIELADFEATGCVIHPLVWESIELEKSTTGEYIWVDSVNSTTGLNPSGSTLWRMPLVVTRAIAADTWLAGSFAQAAKLYDREQANIRFADQHSDDFTKNLVTILAEERLALAVTRPEAFVKGSFDAAPA